MPRPPPPRWLSSWTPHTPRMCPALRKCSQRKPATNDVPFHPKLSTELLPKRDGDFQGKFDLDSLSFFKEHVHFVLPLGQRRGVTNSNEDRTVASTCDTESSSTERGLGSAHTVTLPTPGVQSASRGPERADGGLSLGREAPVPGARSVCRPLLGQTARQRTLTMCAANASSSQIITCFRNVLSRC